MYNHKDSWIIDFSKKPKEIKEFLHKQRNITNFINSSYFVNYEYLNECKENIENLIHDAIITLNYDKE